MMKKNVLLFVSITTIMVSVVSLKAQAPYTQSIGGIAGSYYGASYKTFLLEDFSLQVDCGAKLLNYWSFDLNPNLMMEKEIKNIGLYWFAGGGVSTGFGMYYFKTNSAAKIGLNAIGGVEYKFAKIPLTVQTDIRPGFGICFGSSRVYPLFDWASCTSVRYTF